VKKDEMVTLVLPVTLDAGGEQYKPVRLEVTPGALFVAVEIPRKEIIERTVFAKFLWCIPNPKKCVVLTPKGAALVGECLRAATLTAALERSGG